MAVNYHGKKFYNIEPWSCYGAKSLCQLGILPTTLKNEQWHGPNYYPIEGSSEKVNLTKNVIKITLDRLNWCP